MQTGAPSSPELGDPALAPTMQALVVEAAEDALADSPAATGATLLPRVLGDSPIAVLLIDRTSGQVTYANTAALKLAGDIGLPLRIDRWATAAGITDLDGTPLGYTDGPLSLVAAGQPVAGEPVRINGSSHAVDAQGAVGTTGGAGDGAPVVWATGFPLGPDGDGDQLSLVVFLPVEQPTGSVDPEQVLQALRDRAVLATDICFTISDPRQPGNPLVWVNPSFTRVTGYSFKDSVGRNCKFLQGPATDPAAVARMVNDLSAGKSSQVTLLNYRPDGTAFWNHVSINPVYDGAGALVSFVGVQTDVTIRVLADAERDAAHAAESAARRAAEAARARMALMAEATTQLGASLDMAELQQRLARLCVPLLADWVTISHVDDHGLVASITSHHHAGEQARALLDEMEAQYLGRAFPDTAPNAIAMASGQPLTLTHLDGPTMAPYTRGLHGTPTLDRLGTGSLLAIPLTSRHGTWGALTLIRENTDGFTSDDLDVAQDLGRRAAQALDNARLYTREASVAETLQHALLPALPGLPGITAAARYTAASTAAAVGGDFYDLLPLPGDTAGIVIGDVAGHDITAAAAMGQLRGLIRSEAWDRDHPTPATVLTRVDRLLEALGLPIMATTALLRATPPLGPGGSWTVECANAGHPAVLQRHPDGRVDDLCEDHGVLLGTGLAHLLPARTITTHTLTPGSQLLLFTDGLVEQPAPGDIGPTRDIDAGTARLRNMWADLPPTATPSQVCDAVQDLVTAHTDDVAVLVVQLGDPPATAGPAANRESTHQ